MVSKYMIRSSLLSVIRIIQVKTMTKYYFTPAGIQKKRRKVTSVSKNV